MLESYRARSNPWLGLAVASLLAACGGTGADDSATASGAVTTPQPPPRTSGGDVAPVLPTVQPTAAPTEESPGVYTGIVTCNRPNTIAFDATASEIVSFEAHVTSIDESGNPSVTLLDGETPVIEGGNPIDVSGAAFGETIVQGKRFHNVRRTGSYSLKVAVEQCGHYRYRVVLGREAPASTNLTRETATPITVDAPATGVIGCEEHRFHALEVTRRTTFHVSVGGGARVPEGSGTLTVALLDPSGAPVLVSRNPVTASAAIASPAGAPTTTDVTIARAGRYVLDVAFTNGCTIADYSIGLTR